MHLGALKYDPPFSEVGTGDALSTVGESTIITTEVEKWEEGVGGNREVDEVGVTSGGAEGPDNQVEDEEGIEKGDVLIFIKATWNT